MHLPALLSRKTGPQQYRSGKNLAESNRTVTTLWQRMHFLAPFGRFYGVFRPNVHQIEAKNAFSRTAQSKTSPQQYRSGKNLAEHNRTVTILWQKMHFLAPFGSFYGIPRPNGHQIEAKCIYPHCSVEKLASNNTVRAKTWRNITERSPNYGKNAFSCTVRPPLWCFPPERSPN